MGLQRGGRRACGHPPLRPPTRAHPPPLTPPLTPPDGTKQRFVNAVGVYWIGAWVLSCAWQFAFTMETPGGACVQRVVPARPPFRLLEPASPPPSRPHHPLAATPHTRCGRHVARAALHHRRPRLHGRRAAPPLRYLSRLRLCAPPRVRGLLPPHLHQHRLAVGGSCRAAADRAAGQRTPPPGGAVRAGGGGGHGRRRVRAGAAPRHCVRCGVGGAGWGVCGGWVGVVCRVAGWTCVWWGATGGARPCAGGSPSPPQAAPPLAARRPDAGVGAGGCV